MKKNNRLSLIRLDSLIIILLAVTGIIIILNLFLKQLLYTNITAQQEYFCTLLILYGGILIWLQMMLSRAGINYKAIIGSCSYKKCLKVLILGIILTIISAAVFDLYLHIYSNLSPLIADKIIKIMSKDCLQDDIIFFTLNRIIIIIIAPVIEEIIFRGILLNKLALRTGVKKAVIISSLIFAALHLNIIGGFIFSIAASVLYLKHSKLIIPIILHLTNNSIYTLSLYLEEININLADIISLKFLPFYCRILFFIVLFIVISFIIYSSWSKLEDKYR